MGLAAAKIIRQKEELLDDELIEDIENHEQEETPGETFMLDKSQRTNLALGCVIIYALLWVIYLIFREQLWSFSVKISVSLSKNGGPLLWYCWLFSEIFYKWYTLIIGILGVFAPRKDRMLTSVVTFISSYVLRQYIRLIIAETRPQYTTLDITMRGGCNCSFGMPSGHSEGSSMVYALLFYNIIPLKASVSLKLKMLLSFWFITISVAFSRVYYGRHSIPQVVLGLWQGVTAFAIMLAFEDQLNSFFRRLLAGGKYEVKILISLNAIVLLTNISSWALFFNQRIANTDLNSLTCFECFSNNNLLVRLDLGKAIIFPTIFLGMCIGYWVGGIRVEPFNPEYFNQQMSLLAIKRILLNLLMYSPILIVLFMKGDTLGVMSVGVLAYLMSGFLLSVVEIRMRRLLCIQLAGDLSLAEYPSNSPHPADRTQNIGRLLHVNLRPVELLWLGTLIS
jgi:membrane-associated phospholipid phosphatase